MKSLVIKKLYKLHSWVGLITGILLFVVAFSGAVAVFGRPELKIWANQALRQPVEVSQQQIQNLLETYAVQVKPKYLEEIRVFQPHTANYAKLILLFEGHEQGDNGREIHKGVWLEFDPATLALEQRKEGDLGQLYEERGMDMADFLVRFHADLHLGSPLGLILTGLLGLTLMVSIVTGVLIHRKILAQLFTFRPGRRFSLLLNDGHKAMGVWGLLFHFIIAFTGAFLGLATVLLIPAAAFVSFAGDQDKLVETFVAMPHVEHSEVHAATQYAKAMQHAMSSQDDMIVSGSTILGWGDKNARIYIDAYAGEQMGGQVLIYDGASGEFIQQQANFGRLEGVTGKVLDLMFPLHFGNFGGILVKIIWAVLGLSTALLPLSGMMLWLKRGLNSARPEFSLNTYHKFNKLILGSCAGVVMATTLMFPAQLLLPEATLQVWLGRIFFASWLLVLCWGLLAPQAKQSLQHMLAVTGLILLSVLPLDLIVSGPDLLLPWLAGQYQALWVDLTLMFLGGLCWFAVGRLRAAAALETRLTRPAQELL